MRQATGIFLFVLIHLVAATAAYAVEPMTAVENSVDVVITILKDPAYADDTDLAAQHEKIWTEIQRIFDFTEMARRTLARNWKKFSPEEKARFTNAFGRLLGDTYISKVIEGFTNESVQYVEQRIEDKKALVKTKIVRKTTEIPVDYKMLHTDEKWRVYDVNIEGVSLVKNYRSQFNSILRNSTPAELIERIEKKITQLQQKKEATGNALRNEMVMDCLALVIHRENHFRM